MGDGVMDVENVERFGLEDFEHFGGERQSVRRVIEERIGYDFDFVKEDVRVGGIHADGRGVADEVHVVAARGKLLAELGGDDAGAAIGWVAGDADAHETLPIVEPRVLATIHHFGAGPAYGVLRGDSAGARVAPRQDWPMRVEYPIRRGSREERDTEKSTRRGEAICGGDAASLEREPGDCHAGVRVGIGFAGPCGFAPRRGGAAQTIEQRGARRDSGGAGRYRRKRACCAPGGISWSRNARYLIRRVR